MNIITKGLVGTVAVGAMAMASVSPAYAKHDRGGIDAGDVIAGALIIGGIAAIATAASGNKDDYRDRYGYRDNDRNGNYDRYGYNDRGNSRAAVQQCVNATERTANRYSRGNGADVIDIRQVKNKRGGFDIKGRVAVNSRGNNWRNGDRNYGNDWDRGNRGYDTGNFTCKIRYGRVVDVDFSGIRGL